MPEKRNEGNEDHELAKQLGDFLVDQEYIKAIDIWRGSWGCKYENRKIYINDHQMPAAAYNYYIFRLGETLETQKPLFPEAGEEADQYRFLHETSHAYQEYLQAKESPDNPYRWCDRVISEGNEHIDSNLSLLFKYCYKKRHDNPGKGLSTWGNVPDYNNIEDLRSQNATRAIEDANELVTMYLWHPEYLDTYLSYIAGEIPGYGEASIAEDQLIKISLAEKKRCGH